MSYAHRRAVVRHSAGAKWFCERDFSGEGGEIGVYWKNHTSSLIEAFDVSRHLFMAGVVEAARAIPLPVTALDFRDIIERPCDALSISLTGLERGSLCTSESVRYISAKPHDMSRTGESLDDRVGSQAHACIRADLSESPNYAWMLEDDATRETPPSHWTLSPFNFIESHVDRLRPLPIDEGITIG